MTKSISQLSQPVKLLILLTFVSLCCCCSCFLLLALISDSSTKDNVRTSDFGEDVSETNSMNVTPTPVKEFYQVTEVVDGDTIKVLINGVEQSVRLIGIDTPETNHPEKPVQCFGAEASAKMKELVGNKMVSLVNDETQDDVDKYGRLLRYVYLEDDTFVNYVMVQQGYAYEYTYAVPYKFQTDFKDAQKYADDNNLGLWGDVCKCADSKDAEVKRECSGCNKAIASYNNWDCTTYTKEVDDSSCSSSCPVAVPAPQPVYTPPAATCMYNCSGSDKDCADFSTHAQAQEFFNCCGFSASYDPMRLDNAKGVGNGIACESLP